MILSDAVKFLIFNRRNLWVIHLLNVPFAAARFQAWRCFAITTVNIRNKQGIAIIVVRITRVMIIIVVDKYNYSFK